MQNFLTTKECTLLSDLLTMEEWACKKANLYSRTIVDPELSAHFKENADEHLSRFKALLELL